MDPLKFFFKFVFRFWFVDVPGLWIGEEVSGLKV